MIPAGVLITKKKSALRSPARTYDGSAYFVGPEGNVGGYNRLHGVTDSYGRINHSYQIQVRALKI